MERPLPPSLPTPGNTMWNKNLNKYPSAGLYCDKTCRGIFYAQFITYIKSEAFKGTGRELCDSEPEHKGLGRVSSLFFCRAGGRNGHGKFLVFFLHGWSRLLSGAFGQKCKHNKGWAHALPLFCIFTVLAGFSMGFVLSVITVQKGLMGLPVFLMTVMPQCLCYLPVFGILLFWGVQKGRRFRIPAFLLLLLLTAAGSALEAWVNPAFLKFVLSWEKNNRKIISPILPYLANNSPLWPTSCIYYVKWPENTLKVGKMCLILSKIVYIMVEWSLILRRFLNRTVRGYANGSWD